jgi:hypothetical protein
MRLTSVAEPPILRARASTASDDERRGHARRGRGSGSMGRGLRTPSPGWHAGDRVSVLR